MGLIRFMLAISVIAAHSRGSMGQALIGGREAVQIFYIISGFYMAMILNTKYIGPKSIRAFYINRWLRLWPVYILIFTVSLFMLWGLTDYVDRLINLLGEAGVGLTIAVIFSNLLIFGQDVFWFIGVHAEQGGVIWAPYGSTELFNGSQLLVIPPAFTLSMELMFYLIAPFTVRRVAVTATILALGLTYHVVIRLAGFNQIAWSYHFFPSSLAFFMAGALSWQLHHRWTNTQFSQRRLSIALWAAALVFIFAQSAAMPFVFAITVPLIFQLTKKSKVDRWIGELSYPIYLLHFPILLVVRPRVPAPYVGWTTTVITFIGACIVYQIIERSINRYRARLVDNLKQSPSIPSP